MVVNYTKAACETQIANNNKGSRDGEEDNYDDSRNSKGEEIEESMVEKSIAAMMKEVKEKNARKVVGLDGRPKMKIGVKRKVGHKQSYLGWRSLEWKLEMLMDPRRLEIGTVVEGKKSMMTRVSCSDWGGRKRGASNSDEAPIKFAQREEEGSRKTEGRRHDAGEEEEVESMEATTIQISSVVAAGRSRWEP